MSRESFEGSEFDWFAVGAVGHVGHFSTAGYGPVPLTVLTRLNAAHENEVWSLGKRLLELPLIGQATGHLSGQIDDWLELARRGLFGFDWKHWSGPYLRAATPEVRSRSPPFLRSCKNLSVSWSCPGVHFAELESVRPEELCPYG